MKMPGYCYCDYCNTRIPKSNTDTLTRNRVICKACSKKYEDKKRLTLTIEEYNNAHGNYDYDGVIKLGILCTADVVEEVLLHELHHHILKSCISVLACSMWDNVSSGGLIEREVLQ